MTANNNDYASTTSVIGSRAHISELCRTAHDDDDGFEQLLAHAKVRGASEDINAPLDEGRSTLHWCLAMKNVSAAMRLLSPPLNASALTADEDGVTPLMTACAVGVSHECMKALLQSLMTCCADVNSNDRGERGTEEEIQPEAENATPSSSSFELLCDYVNAQDSVGNTALMQACSRGHRHLARLLLTFNVSVAGAAATDKIDDGGAPSAESPDGVSVIVGSIVTDALLQNKRGQTVLHRAVNKGNLDLVEDIVAHVKRHDRTKLRKFINLQDCEGQTALHYAGLENNEEVGQVLLRNGADRDLKNKEGKMFWEL